jgi:hypothetical protein
VFIEWQYFKRSAYIFPNLYHFFLGHTLGSPFRFIDWLFIVLQATFRKFHGRYNDGICPYNFSFGSRIFHIHVYEDVIVTGEGLQNLGLCSALRAFEQGGIFIVPYLLWHGASVFPVSSEDRPIQWPLTTHKGVWRTYFNPVPHGSSPFRSV